MRKAKATQKDVASACDVSQTLVSLVMSGSNAEVAEATRKRILETAKKLGYVPKKTAAPIRRARTLAYIRPFVLRGHHEEHWIYDSYEEYYNRIQNRLLEEAFEAGYSLIVRPYTETNELTHWLSEWDVDGVFWHANDVSLAQWIAKRYPMVQINRHAVIDACAVSTNQEELVTLAMDHLRAAGHRRIAYVPAQPIKDHLRKMRNRAYLDYTELHGLPTFENEIPFEDSLSMTDGEERLLSLMEKPESERPTAAILGDHFALHFARIAMKHGYQLPRDLSLVGIDNTSASNFSQPPLTSMDTGMSEIARIATTLLTQRIQNPRLEVQKVFVTPNLVVRESVVAYEGCSLSPKKTGPHA